MDEKKIEEQIASETFSVIVPRKRGIVWADMSEKNIERRCRKELARGGYFLRKNRARTGNNVGGYMIVDSTNAIIYGYDTVNSYTMTLEDVIGWIEANLT